MLLTDTISEIAEKNNLPYKIAEEIIDNIFKDMIACLENGGRIEIRGFGVFSLRCRKSRITRNPKTGENQVTPSKYLYILSQAKYYVKELIIAQKLFYSLFKY